MLTSIPSETLDWLLAEENPAVSALTRRTLLEEPDTAATEALWARRNEYPPASAILDAIRDDGSWDVPSRDYQKYRGSLWQLVLLGELWADPDDERVQRGIGYGFSRQVDDGSWSCNGRHSASIPCLTANVGRAIARLGYERDERVIAAVGFCAACFREFGCPDCGTLPYAVTRERKWIGARASTLNGYCHMLTPKILLFLAEVPQEVWPDGAEELRDACIAALRDKQIFHSLPAESREFQDLYWTTPTKDRDGIREPFLAEHPELHYGPKPGWLRFGYPLSYNSDALEALAALAGVGETMRPEYASALDVVRSTADPQMRWLLRNTLNGKMYGNVEAKGKPSKWLTLRALQVLEHFGA